MSALNLVQALSAGMEAEADTWGGEYLHVSDLKVTIPGEGCPRQLKLRLQGAPKRERSVGEALMLDHGHRIHERATQLLRAGLPDEWQIVGVEQRVHLPYNVRGTLDVLLEHRSGRLRVVDYKTIRGHAFPHLTAARPGHALQVQAYVAAEDAEGGDLLYIDREGQNGAMQFQVPRDDKAVSEGIAQLVSIRDGKDLPPVLAPNLERRELKGPDSIVLREPWQCSYCPYRGVSCDGALPEGLRQWDKKVVAKVTDTAGLVMVAGGDDLAEVVMGCWTNEAPAVQDAA